MGSASVQGELWSARAADWAESQEFISRPVYDAVLSSRSFAPGSRVLDVGCGAGLFAELTVAAGGAVSGLDASAALLAIAQARVPAGDFRSGDMESLPWPSASFDLVTGFNSFQYAADPATALTEARRVLAPGGTLVMMVWGERKSCQAATYLGAVGSLLPPPPAGSAGPFALSEPGALEDLLRRSGLAVRAVQDIPSPWDYPDQAAALRAMLSAGPAVRAIRHAGEARAREVLSAAIAQFRLPNGAYHLDNVCRCAFAQAA